MAASGFATLAMAILVFAAWGVWTYTSPGPAARQGDRTTVILRHGASLPEIAADLEDRGVVRSSSIFIAAAQITGAARALKAGEYSVRSRATLGSLLTMIRQGRIVRHYVTIPEGLSAEQAMAILADNPVLTGTASAPPEGSILPDTYEVTRGEDRAIVVQEMTAARDKVLAQLWPRRRAGLPFKTPEEAVILASIVEKETGLAAERPRVASVFVNRLEKSMPLASDPTIIYGLTGGMPLGHGIRQSELAEATPYNTYHFSGLTPTPICNPGRASIAAVLDPPQTDDLYFVADGTGGHAFAATPEQHLKNVERWREIERRREGGASAPAPATSTAPAAPAQPVAAARPLRGEVRNGR